jgi:acyl CoA:acetate/3-ketoacid CoA transferase beta subunit
MLNTTIQYCPDCNSTHGEGTTKAPASLHLAADRYAVIDLVITDLAVFSIDKAGGTVIELADGVTLDEIKDKTEASFKVAPDLKIKAA